MILIDTNVLLRSIQSGHVHRQAAIDSMTMLESTEILVVLPQVLIEFYAAATRQENSLGLSPEEALAEIARIKAEFKLYDENPAFFPVWEALVAKHKPKNRKVFDTRIVAMMMVTGIQQVLTLNDQDFAPYNEIQALNPFDVLGIPRVK